MGNICHSTADEIAHYTSEADKAQRELIDLQRQKNRALSDFAEARAKGDEALMTHATNAMMSVKTDMQFATGRLNDARRMLTMHRGKSVIDSAMKNSDRKKRAIQGIDKVESQAEAVGELVEETEDAAARITEAVKSMHGHSDNETAEEQRAMMIAMLEEETASKMARMPGPPPAVPITQALLPRGAPGGVSLEAEAALAQAIPMALLASAPVPPAAVAATVAVAAPAPMVLSSLRAGLHLPA